MMIKKTHENKIKTIDELSVLLKKLKEKGKKVVLCHGVFDLVHPGHVKHFIAAAEQGDVLVVTITQDRFVNKGPGRPVFNQHLRAESIAALECIDYIGINDWPSAIETIKTLKPDVYVKGIEYAASEKDLTQTIQHEREAIDQVGGRIHFTEEITFSSSEIINKYFNVYPNETQEYLKNFRSRFPSDDIINRLKKLSGLKVLIIGDTIIDEYHYCKAIGKSPKESIICTKYISEESFAGGVLATANHLAGFCENVHLITCLGTLDSKEEYIEEHLKSNITTKLFYRDDANTVVKRRFVDPDFLTKQFEISFLEDRLLSKKISDEISTYLNSIVDDYDFVLINDFGHGFIDENIIKSLCSKDIFLALNTQTNSANTGYNLITKYPRADYICIDELEVRLAAHDKFGKLEDVISRISDALKCSKITVTRGHLGAMTYDKDNGFYEIPALSSKTIDRIGAGDAFLSLTAPTVAAGHSMELVGFVGNAIGAMAANIIGNRAPVEPIPLYKFINSLLK